MTTLELPAELGAVSREFRTRELSTLAGDGAPVSWPAALFYQPAEGCFLITKSIGFPQKAFNIRRNARVSLLFSDPKASSLTNRPAVLLQGDAKTPDEIITWSPGLEALERRVFPRQPAALAAQLVVRDIRFEIHTVGLAVEEATRAQLQCIAQATGGTYRDSDSPEELDLPLEEAGDAAAEVAGSDVDGWAPPPWWRSALTAGTSTWQPFATAP